MSDSAHGLAMLIGAGCIAVGVYLVSGVGAALCVVGALVLAAVIYARTRMDDDANGHS